MLTDFQNSLQMLLEQSLSLMKLSTNRLFKSNSLDLTSEQGKVIVALLKQNGLNQQQLSKKIQKNKVSVVKLIDGLEQKKLVMRLNDPKDRRTNLIFLTKDGESIKEQIFALFNITSEKAIKDIKKEDLAVCVSVLKKVIENLR